MAKKAKRMTNKEKAAMAAARKRLKAEGYIPPDKPKLNRKKFIEEARQEWNSRDSGVLIWNAYLLKAISVMLGHVDRRSTRASPEAVGVAKVLKLAIRLRQFEEEVRARGDAEYTIGEQYEYIKDIIDA